MNPLLSYLLQVIVASGLFYGFYHVALRNKRFHQYNRFYILIATLLAIIIPFLNIPVYFSADETDSSYLIKQFSVLISYGNTASSTLISSTLPVSWFTVQNLLYAFYTSIAFIAFMRIIFSLKKIRWITRNNPVEKLDKIYFVNTEESNAPFSFFNWLFWNRRIELYSEKGEQIFRHELFHIQQKHSWDIIFMEIFTMIFWINPFFYMMKKELKAIHEFLADEFALKENKNREYAELLLMQAFETKINLVNPFFHNQIKRRIAMLTLSTKPGHQYLRKILVLPVAALVVFLFAFTYKNRNANHEPVIRLENPLTLVVDAGHGGTDPGARFDDGKKSEAKLSLEISKTIQRLASEYNINIIMTRENDDFPGAASNLNEGLKKRINVLNNSKPDAFLSIHSGMTQAKTQSELSGFEIYIRKGVENMTERKLASSILQELETIYPVQKEIKQRQNTEIFVLEKANYPAVLLECGYLNNPKDVAFITDKLNQEKVARSILKGFVLFVKAIATQTATTPLADTIKPIEQESAIFKNEELEWGRYLRRNLDPLVPIKKGAKPGAYTVLVQFLVDKDGKISNAKALTKHGYGMEEHAIDIISNAPIFNINTQNTKIEKSLKTQPVTFIIDNVNSSETVSFSNKGYLSEVIVTALSDQEDNKVFEKVEVEPSFKGGDKEWVKFLKGNLDPSTAIRKGAKSRNYTVVVQFIVDKDGIISNVKALTSHGYGMEEEAIRVISKSPLWNPGMQNGKIVRSYKRQPVTFSIGDGQKYGNPVSNNKDGSIQSYGVSISVKDIHALDALKLTGAGALEELISFRISFDYRKDDKFIEFVNYGSNLNDEIKNALQKVVKGDFVTIEDVKGKIKNEEKRMSPVLYSLY